MRRGRLVCVDEHDDSTIEKGLDGQDRCRARSYFVAALD
jgi:hypothetical protein